MPVSVAILTISLVGCPILSMEMIHRALDQPHYGWNYFAMDDLCILWGGHSHFSKEIPKPSEHGSLNVPIEHHPTIRYMVYNGYYKVMSNIPKSWDIYQPLVNWINSRPFPRRNGRGVTLFQGWARSLWRGWWRSRGPGKGLRELEKAVSGAIFGCQEKGEFCMEWHGLWEFLRGILVGASWTCVFWCFQATWFLEDWRRVSRKMGAGLRMWMTRDLNQRCGVS